MLKSVHSAGVLTPDSHLPASIQLTAASSPPMTPEQLLPALKIFSEGLKLAILSETKRSIAQSTAKIKDAEQKISEAHQKRDAAAAKLKILQEALDKKKLKRSNASQVFPAYGKGVRPEILRFLQVESQDLRPDTFC